MRMFSNALVVSHKISVPTSLNSAFEFFTKNLKSWWPPAYTWSKDVLNDIGIDKEGLFFEKGPHNFTLNWARIIQQSPPNKLIIAWQIGPGGIPEPDPKKASEIEINFNALETSITQVELEHRHFERHGDKEKCVKYHEDMKSDYGWKYLLDCYANKIKELNPEVKQDTNHTM